MNLSVAEQIAKAVLYEGYMLYPYRPSAVKNQQRWNFGVLYPRAYSEAQQGADPCMSQTECLLRAALPTIEIPALEIPALEIKVRFLRIIDRTVGQLDKPVSQSSADMVPEYKTVPHLVAGGRVYQSWQEAEEQEISIAIAGSDSITAGSSRHKYDFPEGRNFEPIKADGQIPGVIVRQKKSLSVTVVVQLAPCHKDVWKITVQVFNTTPFDRVAEESRERALASSLISVHTIMGSNNGEFVSLLEPPDELKHLAFDCQNTGTWPVLIGEPGSHDTMLSSPIILYDYPQIAPESVGDLFDGTEIDEILSLRIMTMTDEEKREMRDSDDRVRQILERTETLPPEQLMKLHGVLRNLRPLDKEAS